MIKLYKLQILVLLCSTITFANVENWKVYDNTPAGATVTSVTDEVKGTVSELSGSGQDNGYVIGGWENSRNAWNTPSKSIKWSMKYSEAYTIFVRVMTKNGGRYVMYTNTSRDYAVDGVYVHIGLGAETIDSTWKNIQRNLEEDLQRFEPNNHITAVNGFYVRGSGRFTEVEFTKDDTNGSGDKDGNTSIVTSSDLPKCDVNNPEVQFIENSDDWEHINDDNKRIFCVSPGIDYSGMGTIEINSSGTEKKRRYLLLNNNNSDHPAKMVDNFVEKEDWLNRFSKYRVVLNKANYWMIDRLAYWNDSNPHNKVIALFESSNNIISRSLIVDTASGIELNNGSHTNKIEKNHMEKTQWSVDYAKETLRNGPFNEKGNIKYEHRIFADLAAMGLNGIDNSSMKNNIFSNNEIINYVDAIQLTRKTYGSTALNINFSGTQIINNIFYVTSDIYTDCNGNFNSYGDCSVSENAIDIKAGSKDSSNPIIVRNNVMFGFKKADTYYSYLDDEGSAIASHYHVANLTVENNFIFSSAYGFYSDGPFDGKIALKNSVIKNNTFYGNKNYEIKLVGNNNYEKRGGHNIKISQNIFSNDINKVKTPTIQLYNMSNVTIDKNIFINNKHFWMPFDEEGYEEYLNSASEKLSITNNTFYSPVLYSGSGIPKGAGRDENTFITKDYNLSQINQQYVIRKFTKNPQIYNLIKKK